VNPKRKGAELRLSAPFIRRYEGMSIQTDYASLIKRVLAGEKPAVEQLVIAAQPALFLFCFHLTHNRQLAEDLTHDSLLKALNSIKDLKNREQFKAWLKKIARNLYLDYLKSAQTRHQVLVEDYDNVGLEQGVEISDSQLDTFKILNSLPEEDRSILVLIDIQECSYTEAAQILEIPEGTVKSRLSRARDKFSDIYLRQNGTNNKAQSS
jgi:RNA polymerase sigma-70 factor, ECF subfamily